ncbi:MAG TPA: response regulator transcription factor [Candidatus Acidoferrales bacterium]|jgi:two-component system response regulator NreC|nr:response regulator transcription factor [Candidatus Acidoferrales bacterium]
MDPVIRAKVLMAEDHAVVSEALARLINRQKDLHFCHKADAGADVLPSVLAHAPDVVVLDLLLKDGDATTVIPVLVSRFPKLRVLVFSQLDEVACAENVLKAGAHGFINKQATPKEILTAIRTVLEGEIYLSRKMASRLLHKFVENPVPDAASPAPFQVPLTRREAQVLQLIGSGRKNGDIASDLKLSVKTVEAHRENIKRKLGLQSASQLVQHAIKWVESRVPESLQLPK